MRRRGRARRRARQARALHRPRRAEPGRDGDPAGRRRRAAGRNPRAGKNGEKCCKDNNQNQPGMVIKFGSGVLETVVGSDLLASCLNTINLAGGTYSSYLDACNNGPSDAKTTYYQIASGCAANTAWTDIDMAQVIPTSGTRIYYQETSECPGSGNGNAKEYNTLGFMVGTGLCP